MLQHHTWRARLLPLFLLLRATTSSGKASAFPSRRSGTEFGSRSLLISFLVLLAFAWPSGAADCNTNCRKSCEVTIRAPAPTWDNPLRTRREKIRDPQCEGVCESWKAANCGKVRIPTPPLPPRPLIPDPYELACASQFDRVAQFVIGTCGPTVPRRERDQLLAFVKREITAAGLLDEHEFNNVTIRWCHLAGSTGGIVPDRNLIYLDHVHDPTSSHYDPDLRGAIGLGATLVHEMEHVRQYRKLGTDGFKCEYSENYKSCWGCQDNGHYLERDAYARGDHARRVLMRTLRSQECNPFSGAPSCFPFGDHFMGEPCSCIVAGRQERGLIGW